MYKFIVLILLLCSCFASAIPGDFNSDNRVDLDDLLLFVADWLKETPDIVTPAVDMNADGKVDMADFALFAAEWLKGVINADDGNYEAITHLLSQYTLEVHGSGTLSYIIETLPNRGHLRDPKCFACPPISSVPYTLRNGGNVVCYETASDPNAVFTWKATDGTFYSNTATATITIAPHPRDHLSFGKEGIVTIDDNSEFDLTGNRGIALFIRTYADNAPILKKHEVGVGGYEMLLVEGKLTVRLYDDTGITATVQAPEPVNNGCWWNAGFAYDPNETDNKIWVGAMSDDCERTENTTDWTSVPTRDYTNDANTIIGDGYWWDIDNIRSYTFDSYTVSTYTWQNFIDISDDSFIQTRQDAGDGNVALGITIHPVADVRFQCDFDGTNNTPTQIYDDKANNYIGTINSRRFIRYFPYFIDPCKE